MWAGQKKTVAPAKSRGKKMGDGDFRFGGLKKLRFLSDRTSGYGIFPSGTTSNPAMGSRLFGGVIFFGTTTPEFCGLAERGFMGSDFNPQSGGDRSPRYKEHGAVRWCLGLTARCPFLRAFGQTGGTAGEKQKTKRDGRTTNKRGGKNKNHRGPKKNLYTFGRYLQGLAFSGLDLKRLAGSA